MHPILSCLVASRTEHATTFFATNAHGFSAQRGVVALFHRGIEGVHVDVNDFAIEVLRRHIQLLLGRNAIAKLVIFRDKGMINDANSKEKSQRIAIYTFLF